MKILMLGNGFDLHHKLPTTYLCFLQTAHLLSGKSKTPDTIASVFTELKDKCEDISKSYTAYREFYEGYHLDNADGEQISQLIKNNIWFKYFWNSYNKNAGWIDFEKEISKVLSIFSKVLTDPNLYDQSRDSLWCDTQNLLIRKFDFFFSARDSCTLYFDNYKYLIESLNGVNLYSVNKDKIYNDLYNELIKFSEALNLYFRVFVEKPLSKMKEQNDIELNSLFNGYDHVITFNYTNTYESLYGRSSMHYIHGKLDTNIILGVNPDEKDELSDLDTSYIMFKKYYQRIYHRTDNSFIEMINSIKKDKDALSPQHNDLVVCGHSLDVTDQDLIKQVFDVSGSIYIVCHDLSKIGDYISNLIQIYGKSEFDIIRSTKQLRFITYEEWKDVQYEEPFVAQQL